MESMSGVRVRLSNEQYLAMMDFMERNGDIARPQATSQGRLRSERLWKTLMTTLNALDSGVRKDVEKWKKVWSDLKSRTKKKAMLIRVNQRRTGGDTNSGQCLSPLEERVLGLIGLSAITGQGGIVERGFTQIQSSSISNLTAGPSQVDVPEESEMIFLPPGEAPTDLQTVLPNTFPSAPSPITTAPTGSSTRAASPTLPTRPRRPPNPFRDSRPSAVQRRCRLRKATSFERAALEFSRVKEERLRVEAEKDRRQHERELERERLLHLREMRRLEVEAERNVIFARLTDVLENLCQSRNHP